MNKPETPKTNIQEGKMFVYSFEKLEVWQDSKELLKEIYNLCSDYPGDEKYGLVSQMKRASLSIVSNIAEGSSRRSYKDQAHFTR
jgi:four helix bundle protein